MHLSRSLAADGLKIIWLSDVYTAYTLSVYVTQVNTSTRLATFM